MEKTNKPINDQSQENLKTNSEDQDQQNQPYPYNQTGMIPYQNQMQMQPMHPNPYYYQQPIMPMQMQPYYPSQMQSQQHQEGLFNKMSEVHQAVSVDLFFNMARLESMKSYAKYVKESKLVPKIKSKDQKTNRWVEEEYTLEQLVVVFQYGSELGLPPMVSLQFIDIVFNKPTLRGQGMIALARKTGQLTEFYYESKDDEATVYIQRNNQKLQAVTFTFQEAFNMGITTKDNWNKQSKLMLIWRAVARAFRFYFPDVLGGLYTADELGSEDVLDTEMPETVTNPGLANHISKSNNPSPSLTSNSFNPKFQLVPGKEPVYENQPNTNTFNPEMEDLINRIVKLKYEIYKLQVENFDDKSDDAITKLSMDELKSYGNNLINVKKLALKEKKEKEEKAKQDAQTKLENENAIDAEVIEVLPESKINSTKDDLPEAEIIEINKADAVNG